MSKEVNKFIASVDNDSRREDAKILVDLMTKASGYQAYLSGSMIGFGHYHYQYDSGREGDAFVTGFSPRKQNTAIYIMPGFSQYQALLNRLGKHKLGKSCLYINKLADVDLKVLAKLVTASVKKMQQKYQCKAS